MESSGPHPKPVIFHSIRVGLYLYSRGYGKDIVIAGLLHDLLEDSNVTYQEIIQRFGAEVAELVQANSFDKNITDKEKRKNQTLAKCIKKGKSALIIKATDILDNSYYYHLAKGQNLKNLLMRKTNEFLEKSARFIKNEPPWQDLKQQLDKLSQKRNG
ncbi:hypothetical protein B5M47_03440 [candidate division CPR3 bacterium 4484_211]|uniref:HD/PDEase domain-containing protein n=1 Tax=candidate division CPR3 bacterium 4484_211 TaxID=1968527 RepID=A0A1W9NX79_UNCC3|nr:MAG: hypothetical protein B5M47_03440 [candidate division CPR3 bacterium 4484_211]